MGLALDLKNRYVRPLTLVFALALTFHAGLGLNATPSFAGAEEREVLRGFLAEVMSPGGSTVEAYTQSHPQVWTLLADPDALTESLQEMMGKEAWASLPLEQRSALLGTLTLASKVSLSESQRGVLLEGFKSPEFQKGLDRMIGKVEFSKTPAVEKFRKSDLFASVKGLPAEQVTRLNEGLGQYFDGFPVPVKRQILADVLRLRSDEFALDSARLGVLVQNAGPAFQKLLQLLGNDVEDPEVKAVLKELLSNVKPFSGGEARKEIERNLGGKFEQYLYSFKEKPVASATIGQVHSARLKATGEEVMIKVLRPGVGERFQSEMVQLRGIFGQQDPMMAKLLSQMERTVSEEMDFAQERSNYESGRVYQKPKEGIEVAFPHESIPESPSVLVLKKARGVPFKGLHPGIISAMDRRLALENLTRTWFQNAVFGDGFFHADLHGGNFFYEPKPGQDPPYRLTLIDLGSAGKLSPRQQSGFVELGMGVSLKDIDHILSGLRSLSQITPEQEIALRSVLLKEIQKGTFEDPISGIGEVVKASLKLGVSLDPEILLFNRGRMFLESAIRQLNQELPEKAKISLLRIYGEAGVRGAGKRELSLFTRNDFSRAWGEVYSRGKVQASKRMECWISEFKRTASSLTPK
jgi:predicted unusual protein kinase regulating ubiquinone biosynthesis (AarF/ABC1/UbiB family)